MGFERLAAGVIVIGLILWGASILATPSELRDAPLDPVADIEPDPAPEPSQREPSGRDGDDDEDDDDDEEDGSSRRRGRRGDG